MLAGTRRKDEGKSWGQGADKAKADPPACSEPRGEGRRKAGQHHRLQGSSAGTGEPPQHPQGQGRELSAGPRAALLAEHCPIPAAASASSSPPGSSCHPALTHGGPPRCAHLALTHRGAWVPHPLLPAGAGTSTMVKSRFFLMTGAGALQGNRRLLLSSFQMFLQSSI